MIKLKQLKGDDIVVNADLITYIQAHPNTVVTLQNEDRVVVEESMDEIIEKVIEYKRKIFRQNIRGEGS